MNNKIKTFLILTVLFLSVNATAQTTLFKQNVFAVNELHMVSDSGRSGYPISISYTINNTDQFVAFQFDIVLPSVLTLIEDSVWLFRKTNHIIVLVPELVGGGEVYHLTDTFGRTLIQA